MVEVQVLWNFWPLDLFFWWPLKVALNFLFFPFWFPTIPFYETWNLLPTIGGLFFWFFLVVSLPPTLFLFVVSGAFLFLQSWFYFTSLPDLFVIFVGLIIGGAATGILYGMTGFKFTIPEMPTWAGVLWFMR